MEQNKEYFVFISYSCQDNEWAIWLRHELEHYHLPASFNGRTDVRDNLREVFRDRDELSAGPEWEEQVQKALADTNNLIIVCSPHSAKSEAVNKEIETFIALGKEDHIFPFIVEGDKPEDCFPKALKHSKLGGDIKKDGSPNIAFIKIVAGMLNVGFPELWNRYEIEKAEEERKIREQRDKLLIMQSRFLAEKANALVDEGDSYLARKILLEVLPQKVNQPNRPLVVEAESAFRRALNCDTTVLGGNAKSIRFVTVSPDGKLLLSQEGRDDIAVYDIHTGRMKKVLDGRKCISISFNPEGWIEKHMENGDVHILNPYHFICREVIKEKNPNSKVLKRAHFTNKSLNFTTLSGEFDIRLDGAKIYLKNISSEERVSKIIRKNVKKRTNERSFHKKKEISKEVYSPDGNMIAIPRHGDYLQFCDLRNNKSIKFGGFHVRFYPLAFTEDGWKKVARMVDGRMTQSEEMMEDGFRDQYFEEDLSIFYPGFHYVTFSNDGKYIASASQDHTIRIFNTKCLSKIDSLIKTDKVVGLLSFSSNNDLIASFSDKLYIWDRVTGFCLRTFDSCEEYPISIKFENNNKIYVEYRNGGVQIWDFPPLQELIDETRERFKDNPLSPEERKKYYLD